MATPQVQTIHSGADRLMTALSLALALGGFVAYFLLAAQGSVAQWAALAAGVLLGAALFAFSSAGKALINLGRESVREMRKVVWPTRKEAMQTTGFVMAFAVIMSLFLWLTDKTLEWLLYSLILGWR